MPIDAPLFHTHTERLSLTSSSLSSTTREKLRRETELLTVHPSQFTILRPYTVNGMKSLSRELFSRDGSGALANRPITAPPPPGGYASTKRTIRHFVNPIDLPKNLPDQKPKYNFRPEDLKPEGFQFHEVPVVWRDGTRRAAQRALGEGDQASPARRLSPLPRDYQQGYRAKRACRVHPGPGLGGGPRPIGRPRVNAVGGIADGYEFMGFAARGMNIGRENSRRSMQDEKAEIAAQRITGPEPMYHKRTVPSYRGHSLREPLPSITDHAEALWTRAPTRYVSRRFGQVSGHCV